MAACSWITTLGILVGAIGCATGAGTYSPSCGPVTNTECYQAKLKESDKAMQEDHLVSAVQRLKEALAVAPDDAARTEALTRLKHTHDTWLAEQAARASGPHCPLTVTSQETPFGELRRLETTIYLDDVPVMEVGAGPLGPGPSSSHSVVEGEHQLSLVGWYQGTNAYAGYRFKVTSSHSFECNGDTTKSITAEFYLLDKPQFHMRPDVRWIDCTKAADAKR